MPSTLPEIGRRIEPVPTDDLLDLLDGLEEGDLAVFRVLADNRLLHRLAAQWQMLAERTPCFEGDDR